MRTGVPELRERVSRCLLVRVAGPGSRTTSTPAVVNLYLSVELDPLRSLCGTDRELAARMEEHRDDIGDGSRDGPNGNIRLSTTSGNSVGGISSMEANLNIAAGKKTTYTA
mmetsp:Transcript_60/g.152  ORF Transcript_60/g.152 Transcript_60/m.152 type:complete len:111 (-) Transcript_60:23-355(-)